MEKFDSLSVVNKQIEQEGADVEDFESMKDRLFDDYMKQQLLEDFFNELEGYVGFDHSEKMKAVLDDYEDDESVYAALSLPHELRERKFEDFSESLKEGDTTPEDLMCSLIKMSKKYGFNIGYHTSPWDISPDEEGHWSIKGTEPDHRDGDRPMAYYSKKYRHLFKKKEPKFIYIVRTDPATHKTDGNWSRATELSIVTRVPFSEVFNYVEKTGREKILRKKSRQLGDS